MESFNFVKFWRTAAVRDIIDSDLDSVKKIAEAMDYVKHPKVERQIDNDDDSFFDLVFTGHSKENNNPNSVSLKQGKGKLNSPESPRDVFFTPKDVNPKPHSPKFSVCFLRFRTEKLSIEDSSTAKGKVEHSNGESLINDSSKPQFARADMRKYLKLMNPFYSRASKTQLLSVQSLISPRNSSEERHGNRVAVLGAVRKRFGKSRSTVSNSTMNRRDDSLLEQNDGIQGAILHCKRSYSSARKGTSNDSPF
ncbi:unnamed protein product [Withania somnifera]